jgi:hypothetical protein
MNEFVVVFVTVDYWFLVCVCVVVVVGFSLAPTM